jgi:hypothetical protein
VACDVIQPQPPPVPRIEGDILFVTASGYDAMMSAVAKADMRGIEGYDRTLLLLLAAGFAEDVLQLGIGAYFAQRTEIVE